MSSSDEGNGPSNARAGDAGRLPGIGSSAVPLDGADASSEVDTGVDAAVEAI